MTANAVRDIITQHQHQQQRQPANQTKRQGRDCSRVRMRGLNVGSHAATDEDRRTYRGMGGYTMLSGNSGPGNPSSLCTQAGNKPNHMHNRAHANARMRECANKSAREGKQDHNSVDESWRKKCGKRLTESRAGRRSCQTRADAASSCAWGCAPHATCPLSPEGSQGMGTQHTGPAGTRGIHRTTGVEQGIFEMERPRQCTREWKNTTHTHTNTHIGG
jgi:hypothetical protein